MSILKIFSVKSRETPKARVQPPVESRAHEHVRLSNPWHAVALVPGSNACTAVKALAGRDGDPVVAEFERERFQRDPFRVAEAVYVSLSRYAVYPPAAAA